MKQPDEVEDEEDPMIEEEGRVEAAEAEEGEKPKRGRPRKKGEGDEFPEAPADLEEQQRKEVEEAKKELEFRTFRLALPLPSKSATVVTNAAMDMIHDPSTSN